MNHAIFYDTFVTCQDIISIARVPAEKQQCFHGVIKRFYDHIKKNTLKSITKNKQSAFHLVTILYFPPTSSTSLGLHNAQQKCKEQVLAEYLEQVFQFCSSKRMTIEVISTLMSISFFVFVQSLETKITSIDSYELFKNCLKVQINITNMYNMPLLSVETIKEFDAFMQQYFYCFYSVYELRMTLYQEVNLYSYKPNERKVDTPTQSDHVKT